MMNTIVAQTEKADIQLPDSQTIMKSVVSQSQETSMVAGVAISRSLPYDEIKHALKSSRPPRRPNRNRPRARASLSVPLDALDSLASEPRREWLEDTAWKDDRS
jgi:hypothetical protein